MRQNSDIKLEKNVISVPKGQSLSYLIMLLHMGNSPTAWTADIKIKFLN